MPRIHGLSLWTWPLLAVGLAGGCFSDYSTPPPKVSTPPPTASPPVIPQLPADPTTPPKSAALFDGWPKPAFVLVLTGQQLGYVEPCGCAGLENQKGGLARRATLIDQLAKDRGWPVLPLDVGGHIKRFGKQQEIKLTHTLRGLKQMGYGAVGLGESDLKLPVGELVQAIANSEIRAVSGNVEIIDRSLVPTYAVLEAGGKKIAVTAVLGAKAEQKLTSGDLVHEPPIKALKEFCRELDGKDCDLNVLLVYGPLAEAREIAEELPLFDLVVASGDTNLPSRELEQVTGIKTKIMQVGQKAMYAGVIGVFAGERSPTLRYESVPLDARFADSRAMLKLLADYQAELKTLGLDGLGLKPRALASGNQFVGSAKCGECHTKALAKWSSTPHAHATDSLVKPPNSRGDIPRHFDAECLSCHVTGWEPQQFAPLASGYVSLEKTPQLMHNGCENCHGPGSAHVAAESGDVKTDDAALAKLRDSMRLPLAGDKAERKCLECHDDDNSPDFHKPGAFEKYWKKVEHRGKD